MRVKGILKATSLWPSLLSASFTLLAAPTVADRNEPTISETEFKSLPRVLQYFPDSDVVIYQTEDRFLYLSTDAGSNFRKIQDIPPGYFIRHQFDDRRAYLLTDKLSHYRTEDRGQTWTEFFSGVLVSNRQPLSGILRFNADDPDKIIFNGIECESIPCAEIAMYTVDGFKTDADLLRPNTRGCWWAKSSTSFSTGDKDLDRTRSLCIVSGDFSLLKQDQRLLMSDNFFQAKDIHGTVDQVEPSLDTSRPVSGIVNMAFVHKYLLVAAVSMNTAEMSLYVTDDTLSWHRAMFHGGHRIEQESYTVLESTEYSVQIDVMNSRPAYPMGVVFTSNSNGIYFTRNIEHTNRNVDGRVDFEKISGIQGIFLVNTVDNWEEIDRNAGSSENRAGEKDKSAQDPKKKITWITFDDGRTFHEIKSDGKRLHLHSVTELNNVGRVFSSPAPGLVMGVGNTGEHLKAFHSDESALYVSDDAGVSWAKVLDGPHKYEFGDQGSILVAIHDSKAAEIDEFKYSLNHGKDWNTKKLPRKIKPWILTTTQDSTSLKFILVGEDKTQYYTHAIDFNGLHERKCEDGDMEDWWARVDEDGRPTCIMGQTQKYRRRKKDADCFIMEEFKDPVPETEPCSCTDDDFECDYNFVFDDEKKDCVPTGPIPLSEGDCEKGAKTFMGPSGWRLVPGNACREREDEKDKSVERQCSESEEPPKRPGSGEVESGKQLVLEGDYNNFRYWYLERGDSTLDQDETIIMRPVKLSQGREKDGEIWITHNHGKEWAKPKALNGDIKILDVVPHRHFKDMVYFIPEDQGNVVYTTDHGSTFYTFKPPSRAGSLSFHPDMKDWLIWMGKVCDKPDDPSDCRKVASLSIDRGDHWETIGREIIRCEFTGSSAYPYANRDLKQIFCLAHRGENKKNPLQILRSNDFFQGKMKPIENVVDFATMSEFIVVATKDEEEETLRASSSLDGKTFAEAQFPYGFFVNHQTSYTVLDSSTHHVNLFVVTEATEAGRHGAILRSNSNGTSYVMSASGVNCDISGYVDFEKMLGLEGVILVNTVANLDKFDKPKKLQTKISHNDGAAWTYLPPPTTDADGNRYSCSSQKGDDNCALHIHGYTERIDRRKTFSSETAIGLMFGVGNVGKYLGEKKDAETFMTRDGGLTWKSVVKGEWMWQFGDQGSIIVLTQRGKATKIVKYTVDEGETWKDYKFSDEDVAILDVTTQRSGSSRNFLVWGIMDGKPTVTNLDFTGLADRECEIHNDAENSDYYTWSPRHPLMQNDCLFGHQSQYYRKKPGQKCFNSYRLRHKYNEKNCTCLRSDFEW